MVCCRGSAAHDNCGGFCVKAGQAHFKHLLEVMPERYAYHEQKEQEIREYLGSDISVLTDRRGGTKKPLTLRDFRLRLQGKDIEIDKDDWAGCSCFAGPEEETQELIQLQ